MISFQLLYNQLTNSLSDKQKIKFITRYIETSSESDINHLISLIAGYKFSTIVREETMHRWVAELTGLPLWLIDECAEVTGNINEMLSLLVVTENTQHLGIADFIELIEQLKETDNSKQQIIKDWQILSNEDRKLYNKAITGKLRLGNYLKSLVEAVSYIYHLDSQEVAKQLAQPTSLSDLCANCTQTSQPPKISAYFAVSYAHLDASHSNRIYDEVTIAAEDSGQFMPIGKVSTHSLSDSDYEILKKFIIENELDRFGPSRSLRRGLIVQVDFTGVEVNKRRKSGLELKGQLLTKIVQIENPITLTELRSYLENGN